jgi:hypothetical protein
MSEEYERETQNTQQPMVNPQTSVRQRMPFERQLQLNAEIIEVVTQGFDQINRDMAFNNYDLKDRSIILDLSQLVTICDMYALPKTKYLLLCNLATLEATARSKEGWIGELFTKLTQISKAEYSEKLPEKKGFSFMRMFRKKH